MSKVLLECRNLCKSYPQASGNYLEILKNITFDILSGETISIVGSSGSGKSTLLHVLAGLDAATSGEIIIDGVNLAKLTDNQVCQLRNQKLGFIYQFHHLLQEFTVLENVLMPLSIRGCVTKDEISFAKLLLSRIGLTNRLEHFPSQLSGGERQRVAIARALVSRPKMIFADEPTGNLDNTTANQVLDIFFSVQSELQTSLIIVTHDLKIAAKANKCYELHSGSLSSHSSI